jgi:ABC-type branched-subunit amino acid transport system substrate-binding protein
MFPVNVVSRRQVMQLTACLASGVSLPSFAQGSKKSGASGRSLTIAQLVDTSQAQQDVAKDFLNGSRAAWQDINLRGGLHGIKINHSTVEVDGTPESLRAALTSLKDNPSCIALSGTAGDTLASQVTTELLQKAFPIAHVAPWLQTSRQEVGDYTFPIFAAREEQLSHALKSLTTMGVQDVGAVYASPQEYNFYRQDLEDTAKALKINLKTYKAAADISGFGQQLTPGTPAILLFLGGTPELVQFTQGLAKQQRQRYIIGMANVNLQTLAQMGAGRTTPVIVAQPVPVVTASVPIVRAYRDTMSRLFDEPPVALSLAGFISARYTFEVLNNIDGDITRASSLTAFQQRANVDVNGYRVNFNAQRRSAAFVTQSMLTLDGRVIG